MSVQLTVRVLAVLIALALAPLSAAAQPAETSIPRTADGRPDLQGVWDFSSVTPLQRPAEMADQEFLTDEDVAVLEARAAGRVDTAPPAGNPGSYNRFWFADGTRVSGTRRTSLITDPPNGRLPEPTPEVAAWLASPEAARLADVRGGRLPTDHHNQLDGDRCLRYRGSRLRTSCGQDAGRPSPL